MVAGGLVLLAGCTPPEESIPPARVEPVSAYGVVLDESATPQQVAFVLLRSLKDDVRAAQAHRPDEQRAANLITWSLAAPAAIEQRLLESLRKTSRDPSKHASLGEGRDQEIYRVANLWASIVAYYVGSFDDDLAKASARMEVRSLGPNVCHVFYEVWPEPPGPISEFNDPQKLDIELVKEKGTDGREYWRVARLSFQPKRVRAATRPTTAPATQPVAAGR